MLKEHFNNYKSVYPEVTENIRNDIYVDDLVSGRNILSEVEVIKQKSIELFEMVFKYIITIKIAQ